MYPFHETSGKKILDLRWGHDLKVSKYLILLLRHLFFAVKKKSVNAARLARRMTFYCFIQSSLYLSLSLK